jgi:hypothetical protein
MESTPTDGWHSLWTLHILLKDLLMQRAAKNVPTCSLHFDMVMSLQHPLLKFIQTVSLLVFMLYVMSETMKQQLTADQFVTRSLAASVII